VTHTQQLIALADKFASPSFLGPGIGPPAVEFAIEAMEYAEYSKAARQSTCRCIHCHWPRPSYRKSCRYCKEPNN